MTISIWEKETVLAPQDVLIIGAGVMGLWTALELKQLQPNLRILVLDRGAIPTGASYRNAGFACFGSPTELWYDAATMGEDAMLHIVEQRIKGIEKIRRHFSDTEIDFDACGGYECFTEADSTLPDRLAALNKTLQPLTGNSITFRMVNDQLKALGLTNFSSLVSSAWEGGIHSGKYLQALHKRAIVAGIQVVHGTTLQHWKEQANEVIAETSLGYIHTKQLLLCTNGFLQELVPDTDTVPARGQVLLTTPIEGLALRGTFHFDEGFYYWRNLGNRILLGGARNVNKAAEQTTALHTTPEIQSALEAFLQKHIGSHYSYNIEQRWSGIMGFTLDKRPQFTQHSARVRSAIACNGMGVALSPIMAETVATVILQNS